MQAGMIWFDNLLAGGWSKMFKGGGEQGLRGYTICRIWESSDEEAKRSV